MKYLIIDEWAEVAWTDDPALAENCKATCQVIDLEAKMEYFDGESRAIKHADTDPDWQPLTRDRE